MKKILIRIVCFLLALLLKLRYRITYKGLETVEAELKRRGRGALFMPNHPAVFVDPLMVMLPLLRSHTLSARPLMVDYMFYNPMIHGAASFIDALPMPNFTTGFNVIKQRRAEKMLRKMSQGLNDGKSFLIYPSGTTKQQSKEVLGGAFGAYQLISENKDAIVVLVRTTGLWGSMFSRALTDGAVVDMNHRLKEAGWILLKNLFFFVPRREVCIEFEIAKPELSKSISARELNQSLENWYNAPFGGNGEPLNLVSYAFWKEEMPKIHLKTDDKFDLKQIPENIKILVTSKVAKLAKCAPEAIQPTNHLIQDLGLDSLDLAELLVFLEDNFEVGEMSPGDLTTVARLFAIACKMYRPSEVAEKSWNLKRWNRKIVKNTLTLGSGQTIGEIFLRKCDKALFKIACADVNRGIKTYRNLKTQALLLSEYLRKMDGENIGILLPSSSVTQVLVLACFFAGKTPVMLNWTIGGRHLETVVELSKIKVVLTSWAFLDKLENVDISYIEEMLVFLEEIRVKISILELLRAQFLSFCPSKMLFLSSKFSHLQRDGDKKNAVILFTSGTEALPKGVPLTHKNILSNQHAILKVIKLYSEDRILSILPPFHSFGFVVTGILPLLIGLRAVYYPNPTEGKRLARAISIWGITVLASAPTFINNILLSADKRQLSSLRLIVAGAEKVSRELFDKAASLCPKVRFVEGYGITECSPVLSVNVQGIPDFGVGQALPGVVFKIINPENLQEMRAGEVGLILAAGPNVFSGYLSLKGNNPFIEIDGVKWYNTGDLGKQDVLGNLILAGRLKRFIKVGGEMISLVAIEEALSSAAHLGQIAVCASQEEGDNNGNKRAKITLFTTLPADILEVNQILRKQGFSNLVKIDSVRVLETLPVSGTGKISYRTLQDML